MIEEVGAVARFNYGDYDGDIICTENDEEIAQGVINAAWTDFNPKDDSTWPKAAVTPIHQPWLFDDGDSNIGVGRFNHGDGTFFCLIRNCLVPQSEINRYCDPANIMKETS